MSAFNRIRTKNACQSTRVKAMNDIVYDPKKVGKKFRQFRKATKLNQTELALMLGYTANVQVSEFERGLTKMPIDKLEAAAKIFGVPLPVITNDNPYTNEQVDLIKDFFKNMIDQGSKFPHYETIKLLLKAGR